MTPPLLTARELAAQLRVSERQVQRAAARGELPGLRIGRLWRFDEAEVRAALGRSARAEK